MDDQTIFDNCKALEAKLEAKGFYNPEVSARINYVGCDRRVLVDFRASAHSSTEFHSFGQKSAENDWTNPPFEEIFAEAKAFVDDIETPAEMARRRWTEKFGRMIDEARDLDIDEAAGLNPDDPSSILSQMQELMKKLSENVLTDQSNKVAAE